MCNKEITCKGVSRFDIPNWKIKKSYGQFKIPQNYRVIHQKGRKVPIHLQPKVKIELEKLLNEGHIEKLNICSDQFFISPIVITVKKGPINQNST